MKLFFFLVKELKKIRNAEIVFFFPFYHTGGAEKVHVDIVNCFKEKNTYIFFEGESFSDSNKKEFIKDSDYFEVFDFLNRNKYIRKIFLLYLSKTINKSKSIITLFACNSLFFYKLIPCIRKNINKIDLTHAFSYPDVGGEITSLPYVSHLTKRIVINKKTYLDFKELYHKNDLDYYLDRIKIIPNGISINENSFKLKETKKIKICFVGRWSKEKRPELFLKIANRQKQQDSKFEFYFIGTDNENNQRKIKENNVINIGEIKSSKDLERLYKDFHLILITSYREGFPLVLMEAMRLGVVPICTNVGGINEHIINGENGFLIKNNLNEETIIKDFLEVINSVELNTNYCKLSLKAYNYAKENFNFQKFENSYRNEVLIENN